MIINHIRVKREIKMNSKECKIATNQPSYPFLAFTATLVQATSTTHLNHFSNLQIYVFAFSLVLTVISVPTLLTSRCSLRASSLFKTLQVQASGYFPSFFLLKTTCQSHCIFQKIKKICTVPIFLKIFASAIACPFNYT